MPILISSDFPPRHGGIQRYLSAIAETLSAEHQPIAVVAPAGAGAALYDERLSFRVLRFRVGSRIATLVSMLRASVTAARTTPRSYAVASSWFPAGLVACAVPKRWRGPLCVLAHGTELAASRGGWRRTLMCLVFARADAIVANSRFTMGLLRRAGIAGAIDVVPCGVDPAPLARATASDPIVISVGRLVARKGFDRTISALPQLLREFPALRYTIVGDGPQREALESHARALGVAHAVDFLGAVDEEALRAAYASAWCFALPVRAVGDDVEGFGIVYLEAALAGLATVGGADSGAVDAIAANETGLIVDGEDVAAIGQAIASLVRDPARARAMGERGRRRALEQFPWARTVHAIDARMRDTIPA